MSDIEVTHGVVVQLSGITVPSLTHILPAFKESIADELSVQCNTDLIGECCGVDTLYR